MGPDGHPGRRCGVVVGRPPLAPWAVADGAIPMVKGTQVAQDEREAWEWIRNPLPPGEELALFQNLRLQLDVDDRTFFTPRTFASLGYLEQQWVSTRHWFPTSSGNTTPSSGTPSSAVAQRSRARACWSASA